ncbi:uncharacterized protein LOC133790603 [Humulus lupulus]|uniref:uncharacterized protein LOC133790603 n=1 Tax=Humulus lupulus TaxID=3486 RepID=UPI002B40361C|nr:uncharacterized protein LOC133790603 [Humulus lupulus]XP_062084269.1 uncharacterized protein LOC133790603 [Humulus lupulus]
MAYVPPHKRLSKNDDGEGSSSQSPLPKPALPYFLIKKDKNLKHKSAGSSSVSAYKYDSIFKWFAVGLDDHNHLPPSVHLRTISGETVDGKILKRQVLYYDSDDESFTRRRPWEYIAENLLQDLLSSFDEYRSRRETDKDLQKVDPKTILLIARFGKVFFSGPSYYEHKFERTNLVSEDSLRPLRSSFYTNIPESYVEYLLNEGASKSGLEFEQEKEVYRVYFGDVTQPGKSMWCKCKVVEDGKLHLCKMEHSHSRYMLTDISCLEKNLDLRLDLVTKRTKPVLIDEDMQSLKDLISSAIVDTNLKIGLRWPSGKTVSGNKFFLGKVWRITSKAFKGPLLRLKIREVFRSKSEEATREVFVMLKGLTTELLKEDADRNLISEKLKDDLKVLWNNILCCDEHFPKEIIFEQSLRSTWCVVGLDDHDQFPPSVHLQPHPSVSLLRKSGVLKPLALINSDLAEQSCSKVTESFTRSPWEYIAENVLRVLLSTFGQWRKEMQSEDVKNTPTVIARIGKVIFHRRPLINQESVTTNLLSVDELRPIKKSLYTNVPNSYVEHTMKEGASKSGLQFEKEKEAFHVYLRDTTERDEYMLCKCRVLKEDGKLQLYKIQPGDTFCVLKQISCLEKNLDMRLEVIFKETVTDLIEDDMQIIRNLIDSAVVDSNVQGGLRWTLGKTVFGDKFRVDVVSHTTSKVYKNSSLKLKINDVDLYDFESSKGQVEREVVMSLKGLSNELLKQEVHINVINDVLKEELKVLWNNFL